MAQLYFKYGAMGASKSANALMARFNYEERGQDTLLVKPRLDTRDGDHMVRSRIGLEHPCIYFHEMQQMPDRELQRYACIIVDEAQFLTKEEVYYLVHLVDDCNIPVICYGLRADFRGELFPGSYHLLVLADKLEEVKTICWCGKKAAFNARFDEHGRVVKEGAQVVLGANDKYIGLCRRHWIAGDLGPDFKPRRGCDAAFGPAAAGRSARKDQDRACVGCPPHRWWPERLCTPGRSRCSAAAAEPGRCSFPAAIWAASTARTTPFQRRISARLSP